MTVKKGLFLAAQSMVSYNRGYCAGIELSSGLGSDVGNAAKLQAT